jgi:hypothetical protein
MIWVIWWQACLLLMLCLLAGCRQAVVPLMLM